MWWLLFTVLLSDFALAAPDPAIAAERDRILAEMQLLETRGVWKGVDRSYRELEQLLGREVFLTAEAHLAGAEAARTLGDISALVTRLERAEAAGADARAALASVKTRFTRVYLVAPRKLGAKLECLRLPFELDARRAIEVAQASLATLGTHQGYLPVGDYHLGGVPFRVESSDDIVSVTLERGARKGRPVAAPPTPSHLAQTGPPAARPQGAGVPALRVSALGALGATTAAGSGVQPEAASGALPGLTVSGRFPIRSAWSLDAGIGYRAFFSFPGRGAQVLHLGVLAPRVRWTHERWSLAAGPLLARGVGRAQGIDHDALAACPPAGCTDQASVLTRAEAQSVSLEGNLAASGTLLGVTRRLAPTLGGLGLGAELGWLHDGSRSLLWLGAQATFEWSPAP